MTSASPTRFIWLLAVALVLGLLIAWIDSRPGWDDTGISGGLVFGVALLLGAAMPSRAWLWALAVGAWIPLLGITRNRAPATLLALLVAAVGASAGALGRRAVGALARRGG